ncbi:hypothetical protein [Priestia megaterium]|uniref:hypothetical protein n=1 Tax=Priestia megaterium TaxID=1404 RepID=UPI000BFDBC56|nr:hypothetical protein [Priestia megaterium]PGQ88234.1 hypothetical protein COA18_04725 [Priestia megaterium]
MEYLAKRKELELCVVPGFLIKEFEEMLLECYFDYGYYDTRTLTEFVNDFIVYAESHEKTGNAFRYHDDMTKSIDFTKDIINRRFYELVSDVMEVLDYHCMFYLDRDIGYAKYHNKPIVEVW